MSQLTRASRSSRRSGEEGVTLTELLVVMVILGVVGAIVMSGTVSSMRVAQRGEDRIQSLIELQTAMQRMTREVRGANPLVIHPDSVGTKIGAEVTRDGNLHVFTFRIDGDRFVADLSVFDPADTTTPLAGSYSGRVLIDGISRVHLDYYNTTDLAPIGCDPAALADPDRSTCIARLENAASVRIELERLVPNQSPQTVETRVALRNR